jgi:hypothetical protein
VRLALLVFLLCVPAHAQALPTKVKAVGACNPKMIESVIHLFALQEKAPKFELYLFCQESDWQHFLGHINYKPQTIAFTDWTHGRII